MPEQKALIAKRAAEHGVVASYHRIKSLLTKLLELLHVRKGYTIQGLCLITYMCMCVRACLPACLPACAFSHGVGHLH